MSDQKRPQAGGLLPALLEVALSFGLYYLLRAFGVGVFWALLAPGLAVGIITVVVTVRRARVDMIGLLVLCELAVTIVLTLTTQNARIAALREPAYFLIAGVFCLSTLFSRMPLTHASTSSMAGFGDPTREKAFELAWRNDPRYRLWQRLLTASLGLIMVVGAIVRWWFLVSVTDAEIPHAIDVSNIISFVTIAAIVVVSAVLIQPPRRIVLRLVESLQTESDNASLGC
jgi:hypothetical protein